MKKRVLAGMYLVIWILLIGAGGYMMANVLGARGFAGYLTSGLSFLLTVQGLITLFWMLYYWEDPAHKHGYGAPKVLLSPRIGITALIPARNEAVVIEDTILAVDRIDYPEELKETLILCRGDDTETILAVENTIAKIGKPNVRLVTFFSGPINKPHALNVGLEEARHDFIGIFDAEDHPHPAIYKLVNTVVTGKRCEIVQSGVQLMNYESNWFSIFNVLEYFFWFKSGLAFFWRFGRVTPLGGNTVFFKRSMLQAIGGWDEKALTEDADIAVRAIGAGARLHVFYDPEYATREETPTNVDQLIKQRTRWNQGFLQIVAKGDWSILPGWQRKWVALYILLSPIVPLLTIAYLPIGILLAVLVKESVSVSMFAFVPFYIFIAQVVTQLFGLMEFSRNFKVQVNPVRYLKLLIYYLPYQIVMAMAAMRAVGKLLSGSLLWEKTEHVNAHRQLAPQFNISAR